MESRPADNVPLVKPAAEGSPREPAWYHSIELPDGRVTQGQQTIEQLKQRIAQFPLPEDLSGKTVLDIGAWDGWFSFEMERRGARVTAVDCIEQPGFLLAKEHLGSQVEYRVMDVYDLSVEEVGQFDIVLFLGVLYHLKHPLLALEKVCALTKEVAFIESYISDDGTAELTGSTGGQPSMEFYETDELRGQLDNWCGPNAACLLAFCRTAGFVRVSLRSVLSQRAHMLCYRRWEPPSADAAEPAPKLVEAVNLRTATRYLSSGRDDHLSIWFKTEATGLDRYSVFPEVGGYGIQPIYVGRTEDDGWQANCKLPPGLARGWQRVRLRTANSPFSDCVEVAVDEQRELPRVQDLSIEIVADGTSWERNRVQLAAGRCVSVWLAGVPRNAEREDLRVYLGESEMEVVFLSSPDQQNLRQVNARIPDNASPGKFSLTATCGGVVSSAATVWLDRGPANRPS